MRVQQLKLESMNSHKCFVNFVRIKDGESSRALGAERLNTRHDTRYLILPSTCTFEYMYMYYQPTLILLDTVWVDLPCPCTTPCGKLIMSAKLIYCCVFELFYFIIHGLSFAATWGSKRPIPNVSILCFGTGNRILIHSENPNLTVGKKRGGKLEPVTPLRIEIPKSTSGDISLHSQSDSESDHTASKSVSCYNYKVSFCKVYTMNMYIGQCTGCTG